MSVYGGLGICPFFLRGGGLSGYLDYLLVRSYPAVTCSVTATPAEYRRIWFLWEMTSRKCFRTQRSPWSVIGYSSCVSLRSFYTSSHIFFVKMDSGTLTDSGKLGYVGGDFMITYSSTALAWFDGG